MWHNTSWLSNLVGRDLGSWQLYPFSSCWLSYVIISGTLVKSLSERQLQCPSMHCTCICCLLQFKTACFIFRIDTVLHFLTRPGQVWCISISMLLTQQFHQRIIFLVVSQTLLLHYPFFLPSRHHIFRPGTMLLLGDPLRLLALLVSLFYSSWLSCARRHY